MAFWIHDKKVEINLKRIKLIPSNITALLNKVSKYLKYKQQQRNKTPPTQQLVIHNVWNLVKNYQMCKQRNWKHLFISRRKII